MIAPLVHHEQALGRGLREPLGRGEVVGERLLDEDGHAVLERALHDLRVRLRRRRDHDSLDAGQVVRALDHVRGASLERGRLAVR